MLPFFFMRFRQVGKSGLRVSEIGLGCNNFGSRLDFDQSKAVIEAALEAGVNFFDTADLYGNGLSEQYLGRVLKGKRDSVIIATKFGWDLGNGELARGSRRYLIKALEHSLDRLGTDYIDLYQFHHPDPLTPIEETLSALDDAVRSGKVRYIGSSNFQAWQVVEADFLARELGVERFISCQNLYNLLNRDAESDLIPLTAKYGLGFIPFYPLASGLLTGKFRRGKAPEPGTRIAMQPERYRQANFDLIERAESFARSRGMELIDLAFAYLLANDTVPSVIAGASDPEQVKRNVATQAQVLSKEDLDEMEEAVWAV
jgi:aryl-alcohol dehydrogenase-like predicted oxidoreductase